MILTTEQVENYEKDGAIVIKDIFKPWINLLRKGFQDVLNNPGPHARENIDINEMVVFLKTIVIGIELKSLKNLQKNLQLHKLLQKRQIQNQFKYFTIIFL